MSRLRQGWLALPPSARLYLVCQLALPIVAWTAGSQRFSWAMYSQFQPAPEVFVQRHPDGPFEKLDLVRVLGHLRGELDYSGIFVRQLCKQPGVHAVRLAPPQQSPADYRC